jgi:hypothetical protein
MTIPLYTRDQEFIRLVPERLVLEMEQRGVVTLVRHKKGRIARATQVHGEPPSTTVRTYMGKAYSFHQDLGGGTRPWALKPLVGHVNRNDESFDYHLAPDNLRPIFTQVLRDCMARV